MQRFEGKSAVVTGGASGIGEGIVRRLVAEGGRCLIADRDDDRGRGLAENLGGAARFLRVDVSAEDEVIAMVDTAVREFGRLDCLFDNAGVLGVTGSVVETTREDWDRSIAVLLTSVFLGIKHGAIAPGATVSGMTASVITGDPSAHDQVEERLVEERLAERFGRAALPEDVAAAAVFLASDDAWYVNGTCLVVDAASEVPGNKALRYFGPSESGGGRGPGPDPLIRSEES